MELSRFSLQASERRKLLTISNREIDSLAHTHALRQEQEAARHDASRQALRQALGREERGECPLVMATMVRIAEVTLTRKL